MVPGLLLATITPVRPLGARGRDGRAAAALPLGVATGRRRRGGPWLITRGPVAGRRTTTATLNGLWGRSLHGAANSQCWLASASPTSSSSPWWGRWPGVFVACCCGRRPDPGAVRPTSCPLAEATLEHVFVPDVDDALEQAQERGLHDRDHPRRSRRPPSGWALDTVALANGPLPAVPSPTAGAPAVPVAHGSLRLLKYKMSNTTRHKSVPVRCATSLWPPSTRTRRQLPPPPSPWPRRPAARDCQTLIGRESIQSFGGIGYTWEHDVPLGPRQAGHDRRRTARWRGAALVGGRLA